MDNNNKFGPPLKEEIYEKYVGKYYICRPVGTNDQFVGKIKEINIKRGLITLNPYFGLKYNRKIDKNLYTLIDKDYDIFLELNKISLEPTEEESILYNCYLSNKERIDKRKKELKKTKREKNKLNKHKKTKP